MSLPSVPAAILAALGVALLTAVVACGGDPSDPANDGARTDAGTSRPPPPAVCEPACSETQRCDSSGPNPECVEVCNQGQGCLAGFETCNVQTALCESIECNGTRCLQGQACADVSRPDFARDGEAAVCSCLPAHVVNKKQVPDSCTLFGQICDFDATVPVKAPGRCQMPGEGQRCVASVGCGNDEGGKPFTCTTVAGQDVCVRACVTTDDCASASDTCQSGACLLNRCAQNTQGQLDRSKLFGSCDVRGTGDGVCVLERRAGAEIGVCVERGTAPEGGECDPAAERSRASARCSGEELCFAVQPDSAAPGRIRGVCQPICNAVTGAGANPKRTCGAGELCRDISGSGSNATRMGVCQTSCTLIGGAETCPADALGNAAGCYRVSSASTTSGICAPTRPTAGEENGDVCAAASTVDSRQRCGSRMTCQERSGKCFQDCSLTACPDSKVPCAGCDAAAPKCVRAQGDNNARVGSCQP